MICGRLIDGRIPVAARFTNESVTAFVTIQCAKEPGHLLGCEGPIVVPRPRVAMAGDVIEERLHGEIERHTLTAHTQVSWELDGNPDRFVYVADVDAAVAGKHPTMTWIPAPWTYLPTEQK